MSRESRIRSFFLLLYHGTVKTVSETVIEMSSGDHFRSLAVGSPPPTPTVATFVHPSIRTSKRVVVV